MDASFRPAFRRGSVAVWLAGLIAILAVNGWSTDITTRPALAGTAILTASFAVFIASLQMSARARGIVIEDEAAFTSRGVRWGCAVAALTLIAAACVFKIT
jgi:hypothetical protein